MTNTKTKQYKINAPMGGTIVPKEFMTEEEVRNFLPQIIQDASTAEVWKEKAAKDPMTELVDWLRTAGYEVEIIE